MRSASPVPLMAGACLLFLSAASHADERPQPVSPGARDVSRQLASSCPTFSWGGVDGAPGYELAIYRVTEAELVLVRSIEVPGDARAWTPSAAECPRSGERYAWAVRAATDKARGPWSDAWLFETAATPTDDEVRLALSVLRRHSNREGKSSATPDRDANGALLQPAPESSSQPPPIVGRRALTTDTIGPSPRALTSPSNLTLDIDGDLEMGGHIFLDGVPFIHTDGSAPNYNNTAVGKYALSSLTPYSYDYYYYGRDNSAFGYKALENTTKGNANSAFGHKALQTNTGGFGNIAVGASALYDNTTGHRNVAVGFYSLPSNTTGAWNVAIGDQTLLNNVSGHENVGVGRWVLTSNNTGNRNTAVGRQAMQYNTVGSYNTSIGYFAGRMWTDGDSNIAIGDGAWGVAAEEGTIRIGGQNYQSHVYIEGINGATSGTKAGFDTDVCIDTDDKLGPCPLVLSSMRFKDHVKTMGETTKLVNGLRPVTFTFKPGFFQDTEHLQYGLIAEEVAEVFPFLVEADDGGEPYRVRYELLTPLLLNELQRQGKELDALRQEVAELRRKKRFRSD